MIQQLITHPFATPHFPRSRSGFLAGVSRDERFNVLSHLIGAILCALGTIALVVPAVAASDHTRALGLAVYGLFTTGTYAASVVYHASRGEARARFRRYDHAAIFFGIAGLYTPIALVGIPAALRLPMLAAFWGVATIGAFNVIFRGVASLPRSLAFYLLMGCGVIAVPQHLVAALTQQGLAWLIAGGVLYAVGTVVFCCDVVPRNHEIWHVLALAGSACHLAVMHFHLR